MFFTAPLYLIGLAAVAIPVIVHLFNFRRYRKVYFSNVERLEQLQSETRRQSQLRQILIMIARMLAIMFLVLAFARPVLGDKGRDTLSGSNDVSVYIDNSFSMEGTDGNVTLLEKAKTKAREIVAAYGPDDRFQLMTSDVEGRQFHWLSKEEMLSAIDEVEVGSATMALSAVARKQFDFLSGGAGKNKQAYIVSDFQVSSVDIDNIDIDSSVGLTFVPLESAERGNVYVDSVSFGAPVFNKGNGVVAEVWISNESDEDLDKVPVTLYINDRQRALSTVDLPSRSRSKVDMHFVVDEAGILDGRVETTDYPVTFDNKYYFSLNVRERVNGLVVEGGAKNDFLSKLFEGDSAIRFSYVPYQQMDFSAIGGNDIIIVDELRSLTTGMAQSLHGFVEQGGTVVVVVGDNVDENSYNEALSLFSAPRIAGVHKGRVMASTVSLDNLLYRNVFSGDNKDMELPSVTDYYRMEPSASTLREPIITLANGDDYIIATPCGAGRLYVVAAPLRDAHTDFVRQALFVPTLYNMALYSVRPSTLSVTFGQETPVALVGDYSAADRGVHMNKTSPASEDFDEIPDLRRIGNSYALIPHSSLDGAGNYCLEVDGKPIEGLSFNYSRLESKMQFLGHDALERMLKDYNIKDCDVVRNVDKPLDTYLKERMEGRRLWRWCLLLSLLMLAVEIGLVRFGKN